jgi:hypothetical protein
VAVAIGYVHAVLRRFGTDALCNGAWKMGQVRTEVGQVGVVPMGHSGIQRTPFGRCGHRCR